MKLIELRLVENVMYLRKFPLFHNHCIWNAQALRDQPNQPPPLSHGLRADIDSNDEMILLTSLSVHCIRGIVKFYDSKRGFGFITRLDNNEDIFVHKSSITNMNPKKVFQSLGLGEIVDFNIGVGKKDIEAINVTGPNGIPVQGAPKVP